MTIYGKVQMDIRQIIREELLKLEGAEKPYVNNYGLPEWFDLLDQYKRLQQKYTFAEQTLKSLVELMETHIFTPDERIKEYHRILADWEFDS